MTRVVLSIGSNLGDRMAGLRSVVDGLGDSVVALSRVYETDPWGGVEQESFLNAVVIADDASCGPQAWLRRAQEFEQAAQRMRKVRWGPRTLDVDLIAGYENAENGEISEVVLDDSDLTLPHPRAQLRAFVLVPWLDADGGAELTLAEGPRPVAELLAELGPDERAGVRLTSLTLER